ncbi:MAG: ParB N-terminal domain-containing protein [Roseibium sp.]|nr:ParB N-terminal domain-containing protein [Roseibium sp.]
MALDPKNVRRKIDQDSISALAASIAAKGLLQNLIIRSGEKRGHYLVTGRGRRCRAVEHLISEGTLTADYELSCRVRYQTRRPDRRGSWRCHRRPFPADR